MRARAGRDAPVRAFYNTRLSRRLQVSDAVLRVQGIFKSFGGVRALNGVSLEIGAGEIHCLAGENGSGKSTLIKVISGVHEPDAGRIEIGGRSFSRLTPMEAIALGVQVIYQDFSVFPNLSVMENLALNMELMDSRKLMNYRRARSIAARAVSLIGFDIDLDERVENLSVADRQLIAICRALLQNAKLIIMDEPTSALTKREVKALFAVIKGLQSGASPSSSSPTSSTRSSRFPSASRSSAAARTWPRAAPGIST